MRSLTVLFLLLFCGLARTQSFSAFQRLESCTEWRCVINLANDPSLRLDRSIPWRLPLRDAARLSSGYGYRVHPLDGHLKFHDGIDIAAPLGSSVLAAGSGRVETGYNELLGYYVAIDHLNGFRSTYGHLDQVRVATGDLVGPDSELGTVGVSGRTTGPHLHWSIRHRDSGSLDPLEVRSLLLATF